MKTTLLILAAGMGSRYGGLKQLDKLGPHGETIMDYSVRDAIAAVPVPVIELHLSNIHRREEFRHKSVIAPVVVGQICGFGVDSYIAALDIAIRTLQRDTK